MNCQLSRNNLPHLDDCADEDDFRKAILTAEKCPHYERPTDG